IMRVSSTTVLEFNRPGRDTVRIPSKKQYLYGITILDVHHMPTGCGTWPVFRTNLHDNTNGGEVEIIEGINDGGPNASVLHTSSDHACTQSDSNMDNRSILVSEKCAFAVGDGCRVNHDADISYGPQLDAVGEGCYGIEHTSQFANFFLGARDDENVPEEVKDTATMKESQKVNPDAWRQPRANFVSSNTYDVDAAIKPQNIVINLVFRGDWAGN
ncbi:glycoside hydrolase family 16 protein, partial [Tulasnella calospora MUT 4182]